MLTEEELMPNLFIGMSRCCRLLFQVEFAWRLEREAIVSMAKLSEWSMIDGRGFMSWSIGSSLQWRGSPRTEQESAAA